MFSLSLLIFVKYARYSRTYPARDFIRDCVDDFRDVFSAGYNVHGVVVPTMQPGPYLILLAFIGVLLALPAGMRRLSKRQTEQE